MFDDLEKAGLPGNDGINTVRSIFDFPSFLEFLALLTCVCYGEMRGFFHAARGPNNTIDPVHSWHASDLISSSPLFSRFRLSRISSKSSETNRSTSIFLSSLLHLRICSCDIGSLHQSGICSKGSCSSIEMISKVSSHHRFCSRAPSYLPLRQ